MHYTAIFFVHRAIHQGMTAVSLEETTAACCNDSIEMVQQRDCNKMG